MAYLDAAPPTTAVVGYTSTVGAVDWATLIASATGELHYCATQSELTAAIAVAGPGDVIYITATGSLNWRTTLSCSGTVAAPILVVPSTYATHGVNFAVGASTQTSWNITGSNIIIGGFEVNGSLGRAFTVAGANVRITDVLLNNYASAGVIPIEVTTGGSGFRVDHCYSLACNGSYVIRVNLQASTGGPINGQVDHNTFEGAHNDTFLQLGQGTYYDAAGGDWTLGCTVEYNHIKNYVSANSAEMPSIKSSGNVIRFNYFENARGGCLLRQGNDCEIYGNFWKNGNRQNSSFITVSGRRHVIQNNIIVLDDAAHLRRAGIMVWAGETRINNTFVVEATDCVIANNTIVDTAGTMSLGAVVCNYNESPLVRGNAVNGCEFKNNIIYKDGSTAFEWITTYSTPTGCTVSNNLYWGSAVYGEGYNQDASPVIGNPLLDANYLPDEDSSSCLDAGVAVTEVTVDYYGDARENPPDIGAIEVPAPQAGTEPTLLVYDSFTCENAPPFNIELTSHAPDTNTPGYSWVTSAGTSRLEVLSADNKLRIRYDGNYSGAIRTDATRLRVQADWTAGGGSGDALLMINRETVTSGGANDMTTEGSCYAAHLDVSANMIYLYKGATNFITGKTTLSSKAYTLSNSATYTLMLENDLGELTFSVDGVEQLTYSDASALTDTWVALTGWDTDSDSTIEGTSEARWDQLYIWQLGNATADVYSFTVGDAYADGYTFDVADVDYYSMTTGEATAEGLNFSMSPSALYFTGESSNVTLKLVPSTNVTIRNG